MKTIKKYKYKIYRIAIKNNEGPVFNEYCLISQAFSCFFFILWPLRGHVNCCLAQFFFISECLGGPVSVAGSLPTLDVGTFQGWFPCGEFWYQNETRRRQTAEAGTRLQSRMCQCSFSGLTAVTYQIWLRTFPSGSISIDLLFGSKNEVWEDGRTGFSVPCMDQL